MITNAIKCVKQMDCNKHPVKGFTLIELIISIVLISFCLLSLLSLFNNFSLWSVRPEARNTQTVLAKEINEEIASKRFDELINKVSSNWSTSLGVDTGEVANDRSTFDDVDDYNGYSETLAAPYSGYTRSVSVCYVSTANLNTCVASNPTQEQKKVTVTVSRSGVPNLQMVYLMGSAKSRTHMY